MVIKKPYTLQIPESVERQLRRCRASIRDSILKELQKIVSSVSAGARPSFGPLWPVLRFYVLPDFRVSYEIDPVVRSVVVLDVRTGSRR
jgi:mRNA-degrading endonuclease RelE of RelBE toxin-antitoxin system